MMSSTGSATPAEPGGGPEPERRRLLATLRLIGGSLLAGIVAGAVAGLGSRVLMFAVRLMNPSYNGVTTHADAVMGRVTLAGTAALIAEGAFYGVWGAVAYLLVRRWMPGRGWFRGLAFGLLLLLVAGPVILDGYNYEFFRYVPTAVSVGLFALLYPLYGVVLAPLADRLGRGASGRPRNRAVAWVGYVVIAGVVVWSLVRDVRLLTDVFHVLG